MPRGTQRKRRARSLKYRSDANAIQDGAGSTRAILKLKLEHTIVLQAVEDANRKHERAVCVAEITEEISAKARRKLERTYSNELGSIIAKILSLLIPRGLVFSPGLSNRRRFYGSVYVLDPDNTRAPERLSRRCRVLGLVRETVQELGRAVRSVDITDRAASNKMTQGLSEADIAHDILSLAETGELSILGRVRSEGKGFNLYLPSDMDAELYRPRQPLTWLEEVARTVESLWAERVEEAKIKGSRPKPLTTGDIRGRVVHSTFHTQREIKKDPQILVDAVKNLADSSDPLLRKIKRPGQKLLLWVPVGVTDEEVDFGDFYANDAERMAVAVERAVVRHRRPVTVRDIKDEVDADFTLQPVNCANLFQALAYTAREHYTACDGKSRPKRLTQHFRKIGRAGRHTYYDMNDAPEAYSFVEFRRIELEWSKLRPEEQLDDLQTTSLPSVARGRAMLLIQEIETLREGVIEFLTTKQMDGTTRREVGELKDLVNQTADAARNWLIKYGTNDPSLPDDVMTAVPCWTATEFLQVVKPLYPMTENMTSANKFITLMHERVRRVRNPEFEYRFSDESAKAAEFLFDRTDALLYAAKHWGGPECCLQAMLAAHELGFLRDLRFIFPALDSKCFETRLAGVACLAFLWSDDGKARLKGMANNDPDPGVRQSALWAYGFAGGEGAHKRLVDRARNDPNNRVREFASKALEADDESWWKL